jgi:hypothetical protein
VTELFEYCLVFQDENRLVAARKGNIISSRPDTYIGLLSLFDELGLLGWSMCGIDSTGSQPVYYFKAKIRE